MLGQPPPEHARPRSTPEAPSRRRRRGSRTMRTPLVVAATGLALVAGSTAATPPRATAGPSSSIASQTQAADQRDVRGEARRRPATQFRLATFNVLGSQHTRGSKRWASGTRRAEITAGAIKRRHIDVIGLQEVQTDQLRTLQRKLPRFRVWPGTRLGNQGVRLQIAFRKTRFSLENTGTITTTFDHQRRPIPWVRLKHRGTGREFFVVDVHNSPGGQERARDRATTAEVALVNRLRKRGRPVYVVGDANERAEWFCKMGRGTGAIASNGGRPGGPKHNGGPCRPPRDMIIDWIMGVGRLEFRNHRADRRSDVSRASDHALVHTTARIKTRPRKK